MVKEFRTWISKEVAHSLPSKDRPSILPVLYALIPCLPALLQDVIAGTLDPSPVLDMTVDLDGVPAGYAAKDLARQTRRSFAALKTTAKIPLKSAHGRPSLQMSTMSRFGGDIVSASASRSVVE